MNKVSVIDDLKSSILKMENQFKKGLPSHIPVERFIRVIMTAISQNPELAKADRNSFFGACMRASEQGFIPDGRDSALVPFKGKVQLIPMIYGILRKIRNSGELLSINSQVVYSNDFFNYEIDASGEVVQFKPALFQDRGDLIGVFAMASTKDEGLYVEVMSKEQVDKIREASPGRNSPAWTGHYEEMARKTVLKRLSKRLPMDSDNLDFLFPEEEPEELEEKKERKPRTSRLSKLIKEKTSELPFNEPEFSENVLVKDFQVEDQLNEGT